MTITEFLLARIAEDEGAADRVEFRPYVGEGLPTLLTARVLAECEAKRRIVHSIDVLTGGEKGYAERMKHTDAEDARYVIARDVLHHLASVYADHPDFDPAWRLAD